MSSLIVNLVVLVVLLVLVGGLVSQTIRVVREYRRLVVFRLGKCIGARGPGPVFLIPFVDRPVVVDLRELFVEIPHQSCITKDNVPIQIDFLVYRQVIDAVASVVAVTNFANASQGIAATTLRAVIGDIMLEVTERSGVKVTAVEIREVVPPKDVQDAMNRQMSAERTRRAAVTEAEGKRQATITVAEGEKQAQILRAEGERQGQILKAEGYGQALQTVFASASLIDAKTMTLQVIDGLKALGASPSSTFIIPMEFTRLLGQVGQYLEQSVGSASTHGRLLGTENGEIAKSVPPM
jgi:regulator of protease activity HflC (stomatin/prohibitin superfamily)